MSDPSAAELIEYSIAAVKRLKSERPKVHVLTNFVAMNVSANALLALGAVPSMTIDDAVIEDFLSTSRSLVVNLGQLDPWRKATIPIAAAFANQQNLPWVLDPVKIDRSRNRSAFAHELMAMSPSIVRCNQEEFGEIEDKTDTVIAVTGKVDHITDGARRVDIANGSPLMDSVTAMGCVLSSVAGAFLAVENDPFQAGVAAVLIFGIAGDIAAEKAKGPGSFQPALLDALHAMDGNSIRERAKLS